MSATKNINAEKIQGILSGVTSVSAMTISGGSLTITGTGVVDTISATTYQNLPVDPDTYITGFTYNDNTFVIFDNSGNTYTAIINSVTGLTINGDLVVTGNTNVDSFSATTISATTYQNLPTSSSKFVTGFTYNDNTFTIFDNSGSTFDATINTMTGLTINGDLSVTGTTFSNLFSGGTYYGDGSNLSGINSTQFYYQSTTPTGTTTPGSLWYNSSNGNLLVYIDDGISQQWVAPSGTIVFERRSDFQSPYLYCGDAPQGTSESTPIWNISRITINVDGTTLTETATGAWTNRYSLIYT